MASVSACTSADLSRLDAPTIVEQLDFDTIFARLVAKVRDLMPTFDATVDSDPAVRVLQVAAYEQLLQRQDFNERLVGRLVAFATGATLDHIGASIGVARLLVTAADPVSGTDAIYEDDGFRQRIVLGPEGFAAAGPELAYVKHAKDASGLVLDASATSPAPGEVEVAVLAREGDGTASPELLAIVRAKVTDRGVRPLGDLVSVISARQLPFAVSARIFTFAGPDVELVLAASRARLNRYLADSRRLGRDVTMSGLYAAMTVEGVQRVEIETPAADIVCDLSQAPYRCPTVRHLAGGAQPPHSPNAIIREVARVKPLREHMRMVQQISAAGAVGLQGVVRAISYTRGDADMTIDTSPDWAAFLQAEDGEPLSDGTTGTFLGTRP